MGNTGIRNTGYNIRIYFSPVSPGQHITAMITHFFYIHTLVCRSRISVIYPEERTDSHLFPWFLQGFHTVRSHSNNFSGAQFFQVFISKIQVCKALKRYTTGIFFLSHDQWSPSQTVTCCQNPLWCQDQHGHGTFYHFLRITDSLNHVVFLIDQCSYHFCGVYTSSTHFQKMSASVFKTTGNQFIHVIDFSNCGNCKVAKMRAHQKRLRFII